MSTARRFQLPSRSFLTPVEVRELALRSRAGDTRAFHALVESHIRLVMKIATHDYGQSGVPSEELVGEGMIGLCKGVQNYDPERGVSLATYAQYWVRAYMLRFISRSRGPACIATTQMMRKLFFNLQKEIQRRTSLGLPGDDETLAAVFGATAADIATMRGFLAGPARSLDADVWADSDNPKHSTADMSAELLHQPHALGESPEEVAARHEEVALVRDALKVLPERERMIVLERADGRTLDDIGKELSVSRERVRQLETKARARLAAKLREPRGMLAA